MVEFGQGNPDDHGDQDQERDLHGQQRDDDKGTQADPDSDGDRKVAAGVNRSMFGHAARPPPRSLAVVANIHARPGAVRTASHTLATCREPSVTRSFLFGGYVIPTS